MEPREGWRTESKQEGEFGTLGVVGGEKTINTAVKDDDFKEP